MVTGLQLPLQSLPLDGMPGKHQPMESETIQPLSFGELLKLKEKQLQEQQVSAASIAAALAVLQTRSMTLPLQIQTVEAPANAPVDGPAQAAVSAAGTPAPALAAQPSTARFVPTELPVPVVDMFPNTPEQDPSPQPLTSSTAATEKTESAVNPAATHAPVNPVTNRLSHSTPSTHVEAQQQSAAPVQWTQPTVSSMQATLEAEPQPVRMTTVPQVQVDEKHTVPTVASVSMSRTAEIPLANALVSDAKQTKQPAVVEVRPQMTAERTQVGSVEVKLTSSARVETTNIPAQPADVKEPARMPDSDVQPGLQQQSAESQTLSSAFVKQTTETLTAASVREENLARTVIAENDTAPAEFVQHEEHESVRAASMKESPQSMNIDVDGNTSSTHARPGVEVENSTQASAPSANRTVTPTGGPRTVVAAEQTPEPTFSHANARPAEAMKHGEQVTMPDTTPMQPVALSDSVDHLPTVNTAGDPVPVSMPKEQRTPEKTLSAMPGGTEPRSVDVAEGSLAQPTPKTVVANGDEVTHQEHTFSHTPAEVKTVQNVTGPEQEYRVEVRSALEESVQPRSAQTGRQVEVATEPVERQPLPDGVHNSSDSRATDSLKPHPRQLVTPEVEIDRKAEPVRMPDTTHPVDTPALAKENMAVPAKVGEQITASAETSPEPAAVEKTTTAVRPEPVSETIRQSAEGVNSALSQPTHTTTSPDADSVDMPSIEADRAARVIPEPIPADGTARVSVKDTGSQHSATRLPESKLQDDSSSMRVKPTPVQTSAEVAADDVVAQPARDPLPRLQTAENPSELASQAAFVNVDSPAVPAQQPAKSTADDVAAQPARDPSPRLQTAENTPDLTSQDRPSTAQADDPMKVKTFTAPAQQPVEHAEVPQTVGNPLGQAKVSQPASAPEHVEAGPTLESQLLVGEPDMLVQKSRVMRPAAQTQLTLEHGKTVMTDEVRHETPVENTTASSTADADLTVDQYEARRSVTGNAPVSDEPVSVEPKQMVGSITVPASAKPVNDMQMADSKIEHGEQQPAMKFAPVEMTTDAAPVQVEAEPRTTPAQSTRATVTFDEVQTSQTNAAPEMKVETKAAPSGEQEDPQPMTTYEVKPAVVNTDEAERQPDIQEAVPGTSIRVDGDVPSVHVDDLQPVERQTRKIAEVYETVHRTEATPTVIAQPVDDAVELDVQPKQPDTNETPDAVESLLARTAETTVAAKPVAQREQHEATMPKQAVSHAEEAHLAETQTEPNPVPVVATSVTGPAQEAKMADVNGRLSMAQVHAQAAEVAQQVVHQLKPHLKNGATSMRLHLNPKELGAIEVDMVSSSQGLQVTFFAEQTSTGRLLETQLNQLRDSLVDSGVQLSGLNIGQHNTPGQKGGAFSQGSNVAPWPNEIFVEEHRAGAAEASVPERRFGQSNEVDYRV